MEQMIKAAWRYRYFILSSIKNELRVRFIRSKLGGLWMIIHPLSQVLIFALILSNVLSAKLPGINNKYAYALYLMAGTLGWSLFAETISRCLTLFIDNGNLMKKMAFPRICLPLIAAGSTTVNNLLLMVAIFMVFAALGHIPDVHVLWLPVLIAINLLLSLGLGLVLGVLNVFMRDLGQVIPVILQITFWLTPVVYNVTMFPENVRHLFNLNPIYPIVKSYQNVLVFGVEPEWGPLLAIVAASCLLMLLALVMFRKAGPEMVDVL
ncbi:ABC transporter permease [Dyella halodurans]|uniref:Transport permease protein n=1 Tax=Dyella halodurans TaxID=1920171 RepID=A0ABV9BYG0_9GAMM|nr:ABC transporter permease [Dyella halodurans]